MLDVLDRPGDPKVQVLGLAVTSEQDQGSRVEAIVELTNRSDTDLPLRDVTYTISVEGHKSFKLTEPAHRILPAMEAQTITLAAAFAGPVSGRSWRVTGRINYAPPKTFIENLAEESLPLPDVGFSASGRFE